MDRIRDAAMLLYMIYYLGKLSLLRIKQKSYLYKLLQNRTGKHLHLFYIRYAKLHIIMRNGRRYNHSFGRNSNLKNGEKYLR